MVSAQMLKDLISLNQKLLEDIRPKPNESAISEQMRSYVTGKIEAYSNILQQIEHEKETGEEI